MSYADNARIKQRQIIRGRQPLERIENLTNYVSDIVMAKLREVEQTLGDMQRENRGEFTRIQREVRR